MYNVYINHTSMSFTLMFDQCYYHDYRILIAIANAIVGSQLSFDIGDDESSFICYLHRSESCEATIPWYSSRLMITFAISFRWYASSVNPWLMWL